MDASTRLLIERFLALCAAHDERLRNAIADCKIDAYPDGMVLLIRVAPKQAQCLLDCMPIIVCWLKQLEQFKSIGIQAGERFTNFLMSDLMQNFPEPDHAPNEAFAQVLKQQWRQDGRGFEALLPYLTQHAHVFVLTLDGIYQDVQLQQGSPGTVPAIAMIGQPLAPFIGTAAAAYLIRELGAAYEQGTARSLEYAVVHPNGEPRLYHGIILPIAQTQTCIVLSSRVRRSAPLPFHSPSALV